MGFGLSLTSLGATLEHISDPLYLLPADFENGAGHARYHALREGVGHLAMIGAVLVPAAEVGAEHQVIGVHPRLEEIHRTR